MERILVVGTNYIVVYDSGTSRIIMANHFHIALKIFIAYKRGKFIKY
jgi:hypothetical protein